ncbi:hypothetical protein [Hymenobacter sp. YC55]|uniref:hypothetical protein n=1 Tax=Hymenobacter sp. YC55 TaxID=3034019 RepID=UPI0023F7FBAF|nr:hypothetical protein [Hymenobacter sp. YC55]MDF7815725.1 hypothetical protein [Hymenobacter sp. YC55]
MPQPFIGRAQSPYFRVTGYFHAAHLRHYLFPLPTIMQFGMHAQRTGGSLSGATFVG